VSDRVYVMKAGKVLLEDTGPNLLARGEWWDLF
jgi:ABC-type branched-subunit amino acid transport system ATPase component